MVILIIHLNERPMKKNMGSTDKILRSLAAIIALVLYLTGTISGTIGVILVVVAVIFVLTSLVGFCPLYAPLGISTCKTKD